MSQSPGSALRLPGRGWTIGLVGAVSVLLGVLLGWQIFGSQAPASDSVDAGFARDMSEHHAQAVEMSLIALQTSDSRDIDLLAYDIATTQSTQIGTMQGWLDQWDLSSARSGPRMAWMESDMMSSQHDGASDPTSPDYRAMPGMASATELERLEAAEASQAEVLFLQLMITHHLSGIDMAQAAVDTAQDAEVVRLAESMVKGQRGEIDLMTDLLEQRDAQPREEA